MILISAFEPFDIDPENSSELVLQALSQQKNVVKTILPVSFAKAWPALLEQIHHHDPEIVLSLGQADRRDKISLEQVALNLLEARIQDADGEQPTGQFISADGPLALLSRLPNSQLLSKLTQTGIEAEISFHAGTYVCNALMYKLLEWALKTKRYAGFVHLPLLQEQRLGHGRVRPQAHMKLATAVTAVGLLLDELRNVRRS
ncbi:MAG: pyroglutamyl-peptidase I [Bdellovibrionales bacterium]